MNERTESTVADQTVAMGERALGTGLQLPARLDEFVLTELLGQGGMGQVYKADQLEPVRREVAIKLVSTDRVDADLLIRFDAERQALARMSHPSIAQVYGAGKSDGGRPYFVMEYAPGPTLLDYCNGHELDLAARLELFRGICSAIAHAHQKGVIHRDIKPANILVTERDGEATPKVIDFGLAKAMAGNLSDRSLHTHAGTVLGTPAFMSPEQASLSGEGVDVRTDIYALGLVLYQLTTGTLPFKRLGEDDTTIEQVLRAVREDEPARPSTRVAGQSVQDLPPGLDAGVGKALREDLDWIILKCLAKKPEDRYQSANELLADIERYRAHEPVRARRSTIGYLLAKGARRYRVQLMVAAAILVVGAVLGGGWLDSRADAAAQARAAQQFGQTVERMDSVLRVAHLIPAHDVSPVRGQIRTTITELQSRLGDMEEWSAGPAHYAIGRGLLNLEEPRAALDQLKAAWQADYRQPAVAYALGLAYGRVYELERQALSMIADPEEKKLRLQQLQTRYRDPALEFLHRGAAAGARSADYGKALIAWYEGDLERARTLAKQAIQNNPWLYEAVVLIGDTRREEARDARRSGQAEQAVAGYENAEQAYRQAATIGQSDITPLVRTCVMARDHLRLIMYGTGSNPEPVFEAGRAACDQAIAINPQAVQPLAQQANLALVWGQVAEEQGEDPRPIYRQVIDSAKHAIQLDPQYASSYFVAGTAYQRIAIHQFYYADENPLDALAEAIRYYQRTGQVDKNRNDILNELGNVYSARAEYIATHGAGDPMPDFLVAVEQFQAGIKRNPRKLIIQSNLAYNYTLIANYEIKQGRDPRPWFDKAFALYRGILDQNPNLLLARINVSATAVYRGNYARDMGADPRPWWQQAIMQADKVVAADPKNYIAWANLGEVQAEMAQYLEDKGEDPVSAARRAVAAAREANAIRETADGWLHQGTALLVLARSTVDAGEAAKLRQDANAALQSALRLDPELDLTGVERP